MGTRMRRYALSYSCTILALLSGTISRASTFDINLQFSGLPLTASQQAAFTDAELFWEDVIVGYRESLPVTGPTIDVDITPIDGVNGILGGAGITSGFAGTDFLYSVGGDVVIDFDDLPSLEASGRLASVVAHELGHILGIGSMWSGTASVFGLPGYQELSTPGSGQYTGAAGVAAYQAEFGQTIPYVPVELGGGSGTANSHWDEIDGGGFPTGITDAIGRDFRDELLTGWLGTNSFLSNTSRLSLYDIGYDVSKLLTGDADLDGDVDGDDLIAVQTNFGAVGSLPLIGDADGDNDVDGDDLIAVQTNFGSVVGNAGQAIPEPGQTALVAIASLLSFARGARKKQRRD